MSTTARSASGMAWSLTAQLTRQALSIVSVSVLARLITPVEYGILGMAATITVLLDNLKDLGTGTALMQRKQISPELESSIFWLNLMLGCCLVLAGVAAAPLAAAFFREPRLKSVLSVVSLNFLAYSLATVPNALLTRRMEFRPLAMAQVLAGVMGTGVSVTLALKNFGVWSLVAGGLTTNLVTALATWWWSRWLPRFHLKLADLRGVARFGAALSGFNLVNYVSRNTDSILVGRVLGKAPLGMYQMAYSLMMYPVSAITWVVGQVMLPVFSQTQDDNERFRSNYCRVSAFLALITTPMMLGLMATAKPFVFTVLGEKWAPVVRLVMIFAPLGALQATVTLFGQIYISKGRTGGLLRWSMISSSCYVAAFLVGLRWGIEGVAMMYAVVWTLMMFPGMKLAFRLIDLSLKDYLAALAPAFLCSITMAVVVALVQKFLENQGTSWAVQLAITVPVGAVCYLTLLYMWAKPLLVDVRQVMVASGNPLFGRAAEWLPVNP